MTADDALSEMTPLPLKFYLRYPSCRYTEGHGLAYRVLHLPRAAGGVNVDVNVGSPKGIFLAAE